MDAVAELLAGRNGDPFAVLGPHRLGERTLLRVFRPDAEGVRVLAAADGTSLGRLRQVDPAGLFEGEVTLSGPYRLAVASAGGESVEADPYAFGLLLGELDVHLLAEGRHRELSACLGAQPMQVEGVEGVRFAVWAPNARRVSVVGDFNAWDGRRHPMRARREAGLWELFLPGLRPGAAYKYEILGADGSLGLKADPLARRTEVPPRTASVVARPAGPPLRREAPGRPAAEAPMTIYEVYAGSWMRTADGGFLDWDELADRLLPYAAEMGFTHIELLPVTEYPFDGSWGYQPTGMFAPTARFGEPEGCARFVARAHGEGLGVILDWVPGHFPNDPHGLVRFDGTALYEHADPREGFHPDWNTMIYNLGRTEVREFLIGSALHWLERFGCDGLRVDAVASMLYRDYSRAPDAWVPNVHGGRENLEAVAFLRELNRQVGERVPAALTVAEESTAWPGVTAAAEEGGLGFGFKWNMGWMHDTLRYMARDPVHRGHHHHDLTFGLSYAFSERFVLPLSHDEVVHGKGSLLAKMPGDRWQKFANLRAYLGFMYAHPGKKLLFMGGEFAQPTEWSHQRSLDWDLLDDPMHAGMQRLVRALNRAYCGTPALHRLDASPAGFRWVVGDDARNSVFAFLRLGGEGIPPVLAVSNFTPVVREGYRIGVPAAGRWREALNTDAASYGGGDVGNGGGADAEPVAAHGLPQSLSLTLPPLATLLFVHDPR